MSKKAIFNDTSAVLLWQTTPRNVKRGEKWENYPLVVGIERETEWSDSSGRINHERGNFKRATALMTRQSYREENLPQTREIKLFASLAYVYLTVCTEVEVLMLQLHLTVM